MSPDENALKVQGPNSLGADVVLQLQGESK